MNYIEKNIFNYILNEKIFRNASITVQINKIKLRHHQISTFVNNFFFHIRINNSQKINNNNGIPTNESIPWIKTARIHSMQKVITFAEHLFNM